MKKLIVLVSLAVMFAVPAFAALDLYDSVTVKTISTNKIASQATLIQTNAAIDIANAKGICNFMVMISPASTNGADFGASATLKHSATIGGTYLTVTNGAGTAVSTVASGLTSFKIEAENLKRFVKLYTVSTNGESSIGAMLLYSK
jgi:hypothetical protein